MSADEHIPTPNKKYLIHKLKFHGAVNRAAHFQVQNYFFVAQSEILSSFRTPPAALATSFPGCLSLLSLWGAGRERPWEQGCSTGWQKKCVPVKEMMLNKKQTNKMQQKPLKLLRVNHLFDKSSTIFTLILVVLLLTILQQVAKSLFL